MEIRSFRRPEWEPLPREGCRGVDGKALMARPGLAIALLRFAEDATIDQHSAPFPIDVFCLEGGGNVLVGEETAAMRAGEWVRWPADEQHKLWTEGSTMMTLMVEQPPGSDRN